MTSVLAVLTNADSTYCGFCCNSAFVCVFLSDFYWYIDHSCEEHKTSSVPAPDLPSIPCSGSVQPEHRWQCYHAGNTAGSGKNSRARRVQERWPNETVGKTFEGAQALLAHGYFGSSSGAACNLSVGIAKLHLTVVVLTWAVPVGRLCC